MARKIFLFLSMFFLVLFFYQTVIILVFKPLVALPDLTGGLIGNTLLLVLFSLCHSIYTLGWRNTLVFFVIAAVVSWVFEEFGVLTGAVYGPYHYTAVLGAKLGVVPLLIPLAWFMMIYPSYVIANFIAKGDATGSPRGIGGLAWISLLSAGVMTAWDLVVDPLLSAPAVGAWVWEKGGPYFGIPLRNFFGWMLTTFMVYFLYRFFEGRAAQKPLGPLSPGVAALPLVAYGSMLVSSSFGVEPKALAVIGPFVMGLPLAAAATGLARYLRAKRQSDAKVS
jgi:putative membrane protein